MRRQIVLSAIASLLVLMQLAAICNGYVAGTGKKNDDLESIAKQLRELIDEKNHENYGEHRAAEDLEGEDKAEFSRNSKYRGKIHLRGNVRGGPGLTQAQKDEVIEKHNKLRKGENAADMQKLKYNDNLARLAQEWADGCNWGHRPQNSFQAADYGFSFVGENIWAWSDDSKSIPDQPIQDWFDEKPYYNYDSMTCSKEPCGHYTAVTWASTREVGCGLAKCSTLNGAGFNDANYFVCNYGPGGNDYGKKPYKKGAACSACSTGKFFCTDDLCDDSCSSEGQSGGCQCKASCGNGKKTSDCKCQCNAGATGVSCDEQCVDKDPQCGANPGWPEEFCKDTFMNMPNMMKDTVNSLCPKLCGKCVSKKREGEELELLESLVERMILDKKK